MAFEKGSYSYHLSICFSDLLTQIPIWMGWWKWWHDYYDVKSLFKVIEWKKQNKPIYKDKLVLQW